MYQIKFVKAPICEFIQPVQARRAGVKVPETLLSSLLNPSNTRALNSSFKISTLVMVTNDLGEDFYPGNLDLTAQLFLHYQSSPTDADSDSNEPLYLDTTPLTYEDFQEKSVLFSTSKTPIKWDGKMRETRLEFGVPAHTLVPKLKELEIKLMNYNVKHRLSKKAKSVFDPLQDELFLSLRVLNVPKKTSRFAPPSKLDNAAAGIKGTYAEIRSLFEAENIVAAPEQSTVMELEDTTVLDVVSLPLQITLFQGADVTVLERFVSDKYCVRYLPIGIPPKTSLDESPKDLKLEAKGVVLLEELSNGIARHLWDAGIVVAKSLPKLYHGFPAGSKPDILELGTGIGIVSIALSIVFPNANYYLTDLYDAKEICEFNIGMNYGPRTVRRLAEPILIKFDELDWEATEFPDLPPVWSYIVIADCTYNPTYYDALLSIIIKQVKGDKNTRVILGHKFRDLANDICWFGMLAQQFAVEKEVWVKNGSNVMHLGCWKLRE
ncbi:hypothetical protein BABINDRAFT_8215 [Babjeviella inositovora NRRL Y-12698]|uniref:Uncharacterized protein n=1 Tax=Babjeviella inositovora NRRL Y-12698 TaxID=984486 RepID=A0A1E3QQR1_9ASCO|nr:uncharacterized protein BABINDRAFT_8215 [Babjeviella inositovora NRRL Y-12698]ODQ80036.1 hypothetical protein BABINDRAFT_8215 [Babjeviella inositovora NRRL Y-12698]